MAETRNACRILVEKSHLEDWKGDWRTTLWWM